MVQRLTYLRGCPTIRPVTKLACLELLVVELFTFMQEIGQAPTSAGGMYPGHLGGVCAVKLKVLMRLSKTVKHVSRARGGSLCAKCVCDRIRRAFLIEEQKITVKVLKALQKAIFLRSFFE